MKYGTFPTSLLSPGVLLMPLKVLHLEAGTYLRCAGSSRWVA